jgi:hypothetical protein
VSKARVTLRPQELELAVTNLAGDVRAATVRALRKTARYGHTMVQATIAQTRPKPIASNTYRQAWMVVLTSGGARLTNSARHAVFVEIGRRPGPAPLQPLLEWARLKRPRALKAGKYAVAIRRFARRVWQKVMRYGTKGRYPLLRTMPKIQAYAKRTIAAEVKKSILAAAMNSRGSGVVKPKA